MNKEEIVQRLEEIKTEKKQLKKQLKELPKHLNGWYQNEINKKWLCYVEDGKFKYGFSCFGEWIESFMSKPSYYDRPATDKEVETALIKEAKKRGFKEGVCIKGMLSGNPQYLTDDLHYESNHHIKERINSLSSFWTTIFRKGKWAEIIEEPKTVTLNGDYTETELKDILNNRFNENR